MRRHLVSAMLVAMVAITAPLTAGTSATAAERLALVIGQSSYRAVAPLPNPANDAKAMAQMLSDAGFDVSTASDLTQYDLRQSVSEFTSKIQSKGPETVALVFYAGHGIQVDGENYLIPVDVDPKREADIPLQAVRLNDLLNTLTSVPSRMRIVLLDACRNNPFPEVRSAAGQGLAMVDAKTGAAGTFISYSTSPGAEAEDGTGQNSPYTTALLKVAREPGLTIEEAFKRVRVSVNQATEGRQVPWESSSLTDSFNFFGGESPAKTAEAAAAKASVDEWRKRLKDMPPQAAYDLVISENDVAGYEAFVAAFEQSPMAPRVRSLLARRQEMEAWQLATLTNTAIGYQRFLAAHGSSDLAPTARRLEERVRRRSPEPDAALALAALGPTCSCSAPPPAPAPAATPPRKQAAKPPPTRQTDRRPPPGPVPPPYYDDDVVIYRGPLGVFVPPQRRAPPVYMPPGRMPPRMPPQTRPYPRPGMPAGTKPSTGQRIPAGPIVRVPNDRIVVPPSRGPSGPIVR